VASSLSRDQQEQEFEMLNLARRAGRTVIVSLAAGGAVLGLAAPAVAAPEPAPPAASESHCSDPFSAVGVCYEFTKGETPEESTVTARVISTDLRLDGALVVLEACDGPDSCKPVGVATGKDTFEVSVTRPYGRGVGFYRANGSWVDANQGFHTGITSPT
jgi:hypothetical protein